MELLDTALFVLFVQDEPLVGLELSDLRVAWTRDERELCLRRCERPDTISTNVGRSELLIKPRIAR
jgi:hypothetical protein